MGQINILNDAGTAKLSLQFTGTTNKSLNSELLSSITSDVQTQLDSKVSKSGSTMTGQLFTPGINLSQLNGNAGSFGASKFLMQQEDTNIVRGYACGPDASTYGTLMLYGATSTGSPRPTLGFDNGGRVTMPYQPAFWAFSQAVDGSYKFINYDGAPAAHWLKPGTLNRGNYFNTTTGIFTAPVGGVYQITAGMHCYDNTSGRKILNLYKNGTFAGEVCETTGPYDDQSTVLFVNLNTNDTIYLVQNSSFTGFNVSFGGCLVG